MRRIAVINQKGGVGKTTTSTNLGAALAETGRRVVVIDIDPQANLTLHVDRMTEEGAPTIYGVLTGTCSFADAVVPTESPNLSIVPSTIDLSGAETELASVIGRETILSDALQIWEDEHRAEHGEAPADYLIFDCPPSLGLLALNALAAANEVLLTVQTEFLAMQGMSKLVEIVQLVKRRLNPDLLITGILPCLYDSRLRLAREVLAEVRGYFPGQVFKNPINTNVKLAEAPSYGQTILQYAPDSKGAQDYRLAASELIGQEERDPELFERTFVMTPAHPAAPEVTRSEPRADVVEPAVAPEAESATENEPPPPVTPRNEELAPAEPAPPVNSPNPDSLRPQEEPSAPEALQEAPSSTAIGLEEPRSSADISAAEPPFEELADANRPDAPQLEEEAPAEAALHSEANVAPEETNELEGDTEAGPHDASIAELSLRESDPVAEDSEEEPPSEDADHEDRILVPHVPQATQEEDPEEEPDAGEPEPVTVAPSVASVPLPLPPTPQAQPLRAPEPEQRAPSPPGPPATRPRQSRVLRASDLPPLPADVFDSFADYLRHHR
ncbi:MAG: AAA family ATPase [Planctomycetota bacterium]